jgi:hypothetical protein
VEFDSRDRDGSAAGLIERMLRVRQVKPVPDPIRSLSSMTDPSYLDMFTMAAGIPGRLPEDWARAMFEVGAGRGGQVIWRVLLGLRLRPAPDRIAGWRIGARGDGFIRLEANSWFLRGNLIVHSDDQHVSLVTVVNYDRRLGLLVWGPLSIAHRRLSPGLLRDAHRALSAGAVRAVRP